MQFHFRALKSRSTPLISFDESLPMEHLWAERNEVIEGSPVDCKVQVEMTSGIATASGQLSANLQVSCSSCLEPFEHYLQTEMTELFFDDTMQQGIEEDANVHLVTEDLVILNPFIEENVSLAIPFVLKCSDSCRGLCSTCGTNLNRNACMCERRVIDPRFAALTDWSES